MYTHEKFIINRELTSQEFNLERLQMVLFALYDLEHYFRLHGFQNVIILCLHDTSTRASESDLRTST